MSASPVARSRSREHWLVVGAGVAVVLALLVLGRFVEPDPSGVGTHRQLGLPPCGSMELLGFPCPGCGVTTSVALAARGAWWEALRNQPFGLAVFLLAVGFVGWTVVGALRRRDLWADLQLLVAGRWLAVLATVAAVAWVYKIWLVRAGG